MLFIQNRLFKDQDLNIPEYSLIISAKTALGIAYLLNQHYHERQHLCSAQTILNRMRIGKPSIFCPFASQMLESIYQRCLKCKMSRLKNARNPLGMVSVGQTQRRDIFRFVGLDAAGPFKCSTIDKRAPSNLKKNKKNPPKFEYVKCWAYLVNCRSTGLVSIHVVQNLSASSLILCLTSLTSRYGKPDVVYCDNQTSFTATAKRFESANDITGSTYEPEDEKEKQILIQLQTQAIDEWACENSIKFEFGIPSYPQSQGSSEVSISALKKLMFLDDFALVLPEIHQIIKDDPTRTETEAQISNIVLDSTNLSVLEYQALFDRLAYKLNNRPYHFINQELFSRFDLLCTRTLTSRSDPAIMKDSPLNASDDFYAELKLADLLLDLYWKRYLNHLIPNLMKIAHHRWPSLDYQNLKRDAIVMIKDRAKNSGNLEIARIVFRKKPHEGDVHRRYDLEIIRKKRGSSHPLPLRSVTTSRGLLERTGDQLIFLGRPSKDYQSFPLMLDPSLTQDELFLNPKNITREGLVVKFKAPPAYSHTYPGLDPISSSDDDDDFIPHTSKEPWLFKVKKNSTPNEKEDPALPDNESAAEQVDVNPDTIIPDNSASENDNSLSERVKIIRSKDATPFVNTFTKIENDKIGVNLFIAVANSITLLDEDKILKGKRNTYAKTLRDQVFTYIIGLLNSEFSDNIFALSNETEEDKIMYSSVIRDVANSFLEKPNQTKVPDHFYEEFQNVKGSLDTLFLVSLFEESLPNFISTYLRRDIFVFSDGSSQNLYHYDGFTSITSETYNLTPILIYLTREGQFNGTQFTPKYKDFFRILKNIGGDQSLQIKENFIQRSIQILEISSQE